PSQPGISVDLIPAHRRELPQSEQHGVLLVPRKREELLLEGGAIEIESNPNVCGGHRSTSPRACPDPSRAADSAASIRGTLRSSPGPRGHGATARCRG